MRKSGFPHFLWQLVLVLLCGFLLWDSSLNQGLFAYLHQTLQNWVPAAAWRMVSVFGDWPIVCALLFAFIWPLPNKRLPIILSTTVLILLTSFSKWLFAVPRPPLVLGEAVHLLSNIPNNGSFPSGHAIAIGFAGALLFLLYGQLPQRSYLKWLAGLMLLLVSLSRIAIGVHWPMDVLTGVLIGVIWARESIRYDFPLPLIASRLVAGVLSAALVFISAFYFLKPDSNDVFVLRQLILGCALTWVCSYLWRERKLGKEQAALAKK